MSQGLAEAASAGGPPPAAPVRTHARLASREITPDDAAAIAALLHEGFPDRPPCWFQSALDSMARLPAIPGLPRYGYMLTEDGKPIGAVLALVSQTHRHGRSDTRLNVACWYVRPRYRAYGTVLYQRLLALRNVTLLNVTPALHTWPVIEAQGFRRFADGMFAGVPLLGRSAPGLKVHVAGSPADGALSAEDRALLAFHARAGCIAFTCAPPSHTRGHTPGHRPGHTLPFVFRKRTYRNLPPAAHLIYCRDLDDLGACAGAIGRHLVRHGLAWIVAGTNGPLPGMPGRYFPGKSPMYFKGPSQPRPGDLAYTETALLAQGSFRKEGVAQWFNARAGWHRAKDRPYQAS